MSVQGPLTRTVADARLALQVISQGTPLDPQWVPAPLDYPDTLQPLKVAVLKHHAAYDVAPSVTAAIDQAAQWLAQAGCEVIKVEPPHFEEGATLWNQLVMDDMRRGGQLAIQTMGDAAIQATLRGYMHGLAPLTSDQWLQAQMRHFNILRNWAVFLEE